MAVVGSTVVLSSSSATIVALAPNPGRELNDPIPVVLVNPSASASTVWVGGSSVTAGTFGIPLAVGASIALNLVSVTDTVYAIATTGTPTFCVLKLRQ